MSEPLYEYIHISIITIRRRWQFNLIQSQFNAKLTIFLTKLITEQNFCNMSVIVLLPVAVKEHYKFNAGYIHINHLLPVYRRQITIIILSLLAKTEEEVTLF